MTAREESKSVAPIPSEEVAPCGCPTHPWGARICAGHPDCPLRHAGEVETPEAAAEAAARAMYSMWGLDQCGDDGSAWDDCMKAATVALKAALPALIAAGAGWTPPGMEYVEEGWWHPNVKSGQVHDHPERPGGSWSVASHRLCEPVYTKRIAQGTPPGGTDAIE